MFHHSRAIVAGSSVATGTSVRILIAALSAYILATGQAVASETDAVLGVWNTAEGKSKVEVYKCGDKFCGKIIWLKKPTYPMSDEEGMGGQAKIDRKNPSESLRSRSIIGLNIIESFEYDGDAKWQDGTIYDPQSGKTYSSKMTLIEPGKLELRGYVGIPLFGRTVVWTR